MKTNGINALGMILSIAWALLIFYFCTLSPGKIPTFKIPHADKAVHFGFFFVQSVLFSLTFNLQARKSYLRTILWASLLALLYGGLIEILQSRFFHRTGDVYDLVADILGGFLGAIIYPTLVKIYGKTLKKYK